MRNVRKLVAITVVCGTFGLTGPALAASYHKPTLKYTPRLEQRVGRGYDARRPTRRVSPTRQRQRQGWNRPKGWGRHQGYGRKVMHIRRTPSRNWQGRFRMR